MEKPRAADAAACVLIVDDTPANLQLLVEMLRRRGFKARAALSGALALRAAQNDPPDLILLDINMPEMNGFEVCARLKADPKLRDIPVIFISAMNETIDKVKAFGVGGVDYVTKPFQFEEVEARVDAHLRICRQRRELQESYDDLRRLEAQRDSLVHMIIHDLRTPLTTIHGFLRWIIEDGKGGISAESVEHLQICSKATKDMIRMAEAVLDVSKLEAGQMKLQVGPCDLVPVVDAALAEMRPQIGARQVRFTPRPEHAVVPADGDVVARIVQNLLGNAAKFAPPDGWIRVGVEVRETGVRVSIEDNGPGVAPEHREAIFEKWGQVDLARQPRHSVGLGLTFCREAVAAHGGRIAIDSTVGEGSTFWFELPAAGPPKPAPEPGA